MSSTHYNTKSEVTSAVATNQTTYNYGFLFDPIGNRLTSSSTETGSTVTRNYTANNLNQYTAIDNPTAAPTYDFDGNMTQCSLGVPPETWSFTFDCENRMIAAEKTGQRLEFSYDYMSRRVEKKVYSGSTGNWTLDKHLKFVCDGYLQIEELNALDSNAVLKKRIWSPAINGLGSERYLSEIQGSTAYYALGDANRNITEYLDSTGTIQGHYEFSPFGKITVASGMMPDAFNYRFSSEYFDSETSLVYYNYRYYSPELGRWLSRDPIGEDGFMLVQRQEKSEYDEALYCFVSNNPVNKYDNKGLLGYPPIIIGATMLYVGCMSSFYLKALEFKDSDGYDDKFRHCFVTCKSSSYCGAGPGGAIVIGVLYELCGQTGNYTEWPILKTICPAFGDLKDSIRDIGANLIGAGCSKLPITCKCCCKKATQCLP